MADAIGEGDKEGDPDGTRDARSVLDVQPSEVGDDAAKGPVLGQGEFRLPGHGCGGGSASRAVLVLVDASQEKLVPSLSPRVEGAAHWSASNRHGLGYGG